MPITLNGTAGEIPATWTTATRPASPTAGQIGYNTTTAALDVYNGSAWTTALPATSGLATLSNLALNGSSSGTTTLSPSAVASGTVTLPAGTGTVAVNGLSTNLVLSTAQTVSAVTSVGFTGIPSWVKRITVNLSAFAVSSGTPTLTMRIGAGAYDATSYNSIASRNITTSINNNTATTAFVLNVGTAGTYYGSIVLTNVTGNIWALSSILADPANNALNTAAGTHTTSAALSQLQLIMSDGTSTMTGTINIAYE